MPDHSGSTDRPLRIHIMQNTVGQKKKEKGRETDREREKKRRLDMQPVSKEEKKSAFKNKTKKIKQIFL